MTTSMDVQAQADALQTTTTTRNVALGGDRIEDAPATNRNYLNFVLTAPGVAPSQGANTSGSAARVRNVAKDSALTFVGIRGRNNGITIDGVDNRDETTGGNRHCIERSLTAARLHLLCPPGFRRSSSLECCDPESHASRVEVSQFST